MWRGNIKNINIWKEDSNTKANDNENNKSKLDEPVELLGLSSKAYNCIKRNRLNTIKDIVNLINNNKLMKVRGLGEKSVKEIEIKVEHFIM